MASLLLCGAVSAQHFTAPDAHAKSGNTPIVAAVTVDNAAPATGAELAVFVGEGENEELRGLATAYDDGKFWVQAFYNTGSTETLTFKLWNPADGGAELTNYVLTYTYTDSNNQTVTLDALTTCEEGYGTPSNPVEIDFATTQMMTQNSPLVTGWNWWSTPIEMNGIDGLTMLEERLGNTGIRIQSKSSSIDFYDIEGYTFWDGQLNEITNEQMYKIRTSVGSTISFTGIPANPANHTITITKGWNWIGFPSGTSVNLEDALGDFTPENEDIIKGVNSFSQYYIIEGFAFWDGGLTTLIPGKGYMYQSNSNNTKYLTFQNGSRGTMVENASLSGETFLARENDFADNMTITAKIELEGEILRSDNYELAAFVGNDCRGSIKLKYVSPLDQYLAFLLVHGDQEESLRFVLTDGQEYSWSKDYMIYSSDATFGSPTQPIVLHFGPMGVNENNSIMVNIYPNPSHDVFNIESEDIQKVEVINAFGQVIYSKEIVNNSIQIDLSRHSTGAYLVRVVTNNGVVTQQIIKE